MFLLFCTCSQAFAGQIDVYDILNQVRNSSHDADMDDLGVTPLDGYQLSKEKIIRRDRNSVDSFQGNPIRIPGRRRTIELGESQDSFRVSEKRRSVDSDTSRQEDTKSEDSEMVMSETGNIKESVGGVAVKEDAIENQTDVVTQDAQEEAVPTVKPEENLPNETDSKPLSSAQDKSEGKPPVEDVNTEGEPGVRDENPDASDVKADVVTTNIPASARDSANDFKGFIDASECVKRHLKELQGKTIPDGESDNDFKGFTNTSEYMEHHLKLMQGKNAFQVRDDGDFDDLDNLDNSDAQETDSPLKGDPEVSEVRGSDVSENEADKTTKIGESNVNDKPFPSEEEENVSQPPVFSDKGEEVANQDPQSVETGDGENLRNTDATCESKAVHDDKMEITGDNNQGELEELLDNVENNQGASAVLEESRRESCEGNGGLDVVEQLNEGESEELADGNDGSTCENAMRFEGNGGEIEGNEIGVEESEHELRENEATLGENESYHEVEEGMEDDEMMNAEVTETEAAVNALKGIMALQPTEILGLPEPDFDYENEFAEYFDGGVYEDEEDDMMHNVDQGEEDDNGQGMMEDIQDIEGSPENQEQQDYTEQEETHQREHLIQEEEGETQDGEVDEEEERQQEEGDKNLRSEDRGNTEKDNDKPKEIFSGEEKQPERRVEDNTVKGKEGGAGMRGKHLKENKDMMDKDDNSYKTVTDDSTTTDTTCKTAAPTQVRKPKRTKRGLERELEQLDYWGRRQERDAKRRRRTISSKLLGAIEEAEYLTWGDLLRSFVPGTLL